MRKKTGCVFAAARVLVYALLMLGLWHPCAWAQAPSVEKSGGEAASSDGMQYVIGLGDILEVHVWKEPELSRTALPVRMDGRVALPLLGDVVAAGKTPTELALFIQQRLKEFIGEPAVSVLLSENRSRRYYVIGQVEKGGEFLIDFPISVLQAIARCGGFREWAKTSEIVVIRRESGREKKLLFDFDAVRKGSDPGKNLLVAPGDTIIIP